MFVTYVVGFTTQKLATLTVELPQEQPSRIFQMIGYALFVA